MSGSAFDARNQLGGGPSQLPGSTALSGTTAANGSSVDCDLIDGPITLFVFTGTATGSPTSFSVAAKLQESDDGSSGWTDLATQETLSMTSGGSRGALRGIRTKRYLRSVLTPAFVGGSSPTVPTTSFVTGNLRRT
jgi:hypothetical protein